jgi:arsenate reductase (thioredoxin)
LKRRVLFLCATNGVTSPIAEALFTQIDSVHFESFSACTTSQEIHPLSMEVIKEIGVDLKHHGPRSLDELKLETFDFLITLDDACVGHESALHAAETVHWKFENPANASTDHQVLQRAFRSIRDQIAQRLRLFAIVHSRVNSASERTRIAEAKSTTAAIIG